MRKNNMYPQLFTILGLTASLLLGSGHQALASNTNQPQMESLTKEIEFQTTDKDEDASKYFTSSITENDKIFHIEDISTEIINTQTTEAEYAIYDSPAFIDETMVEKPKDTINLADIIWKIEKEVPSAPEKKSGGFFGLFLKKDKKEPKPPKTKKNKKEEN